MCIVGLTFDNKASKQAGSETQQNNNIDMTLYNTFQAHHLAPRPRTESRHVIPGCAPEVVAEIVVAQLRPQAAITTAEELVPEPRARPVVPSHQRAAVEVAEVILGVALIAAVGHSEAVGGAAVLVVDDQGVRAVDDDDVGAAGILVVGRWRDPDDFVPAGEDDDVLPVVSVAAREAP